MHIPREDGAVTEVLLLAECTTGPAAASHNWEIPWHHWPPLALVSTLLSQSPDDEKEMDPGSISLYKMERKSQKMTFQFTRFSSLLCFNSSVTTRLSF